MTESEQAAESVRCSWSGCSWSANRLPHTAHGDCVGFMPELVVGLQNLMDHQARVDMGGRDEDESAEAQIAAVRALIPAECWVYRTTEITCRSLVGGSLPNGAVWTEGMCCLPCRIRAAVTPTAPRSDGVA